MNLGSFQISSFSKCCFFVCEIAVCEYRFCKTFCVSRMLRVSRIEKMCHEWLVSFILRNFFAAFTHFGVFLSDIGLVFFWGLSFILRRKCIVQTFASGVFRHDAEASITNTSRLTTGGLVGTGFALRQSSM